MKRYIVTGCSGFIGRHLTKSLLSDGHQVLGFDNFHNGRKSNMDEFYHNPNFVFSQTDLSNLDDIKKLKPLYYPFDGVFHVAFVPRVQYSIENPLSTDRNNVGMTINLLEFMVASKIKNIVFSSSSSVYGDPRELPTTEKHPLNPLSPYAVQKMNSEEYIKQYSRLYNINFTNLRYFNVYGEFQDPSGEYANLIPRTINRCLNGEKPIVYGDGKNQRDFVYVEDVVNANKKAMELTSEKSLGAINICSSSPHTINDIVNTIAQLTGYTGGIEYRPKRVEPTITYGDNSRAQEILKWKPQVSFEESLDREVRYFKTCVR